MSKKYITTAIPYVNARPHIGHAMDYLLADIWARYYLQRGDTVRYSAGTDEHGTKVAQKAAEAGLTPQKFVDDLVPSFLEMQDKLKVVRTDFVRTSDPEHMRRCQGIWRRLDAAGVIYKGSYEGWYCAGCEGFVTESEAKEMNYVCPDHQKPLEKLSEENYYLRVSDFTEQIREFVASAVVPEFRGKEILELIKDGAQDVSISRPKEKLNWGVPVPDDDSQVMYVWVDALSNYITALRYPDDGWDKDFWPADVEVIGKDILRFHAVIWPAILLALGLDLPKKLLVHGFVNVGGGKMSKSIGNVIDPNELIDKYGLDAFRYFFTRHIPTFDDGDYTEEKFVAAYNGELANDLGNLVSRAANMAERFLIGGLSCSKKADTNKFDEITEEYDGYFAKFRFDMALDTVWTLIQDMNKFIEAEKPWELAKSDPNKLSEVMGHLIVGLRQTAKLLAPFLPDTSKKIEEVFGGDKLGKLDAVLFPKR
ncbi:MAG: methionine--tRNA ligase [Candidatus Nomurabacteria bacterium]|jgi:methionyl-tRNA synthetase|nr:methionine--tRNA ligase [Candidatus Nomurabacteria bacterium]